MLLYHKMGKNYLQCTMVGNANAAKTDQVIDQLVAKSNEIDRKAELMASHKDEGDEYLEFTLSRDKFVDLITHNDAAGVNDGTDVDKQDLEFKFNGGAELKGNDLAALSPTLINAKFRLEEDTITLQLAEYFTYTADGEHEHEATTTGSSLDVTVQGVVASGTKVTYTWQHVESEEVCVTKVDNELAKDYVRIDGAAGWTADPEMPSATQGNDVLKACTTLAANQNYTADMDITGNLTSIKISDAQITLAVNEVMQAVTHASDQATVRATMKADRTVFKGLTSALPIAATVTGSVGIHNQKAEFETQTGIVVTFA
jgi:hypothetical protein